MDVEEKVDNFNGRGEVRELVPVQNQNSPANIMRIALTHGQDLVEVEKMLNLQIKWEENEAKKDYHLAMAEFKKNAPSIKRTNKVSYTTDKGTTSYSHADLGKSSEQINTELSKQGLSSTWKTSQGESKITVTCIITHKHGHSEETSLSAGADNSGGKNAIQGIGSTIFYLQRYTLFALTGLAPHGMDDDGMGSDPPEGSDDFISEAQLKDLIKEKEAVGMPDKLFLRSLKVDVLSELPASRFKFAMGILKARKGN
ncbi:MAG: ERF family protein [Syntrophaceae bacterium]|nr:ERF family protein [Syntrophaceae bacterium]